jgi:hypothetical protein
MNAVEAEEVNPPLGQEAIHWRLLTTHSVVCLEQALKVIQWYRWRWRIEQLFATLKKAGLNLEATQLESVTAIQRLTILALGVPCELYKWSKDGIIVTYSFCASLLTTTMLVPTCRTLEGTHTSSKTYPRCCLGILADCSTLVAGSGYVSWATSWNAHSCS